MKEDPRSEKLARLQGRLREFPSVLVAFSGGVDSAFLLRVAADVLKDRCHAVTAVSATMARSEIEDARALGAELGLGERHHMIESNELDRPGFAHNPPTRCAACKSELMGVATPIAHRMGATVVLGTNLDDLGDFRPGIAAATEAGAQMPLVDASLTKAEIRTLSRDLGLRTWNKPQLACLSSRFPYGTTITVERLRQVDEVEDSARSLGFSQVRARFHEATVRLELLPDEIHRAFDPVVRKHLVTAAKRAGFTYVAVDLEGFRSGSMNEGLIPLGRRSHA